jgi:FkbM family methyltransferase
MSALTHAAKRLALATGLYRPARWLSTRVRPGKLAAFREEVAFYRSLLPTNALSFDVGANIGDKSEALLTAGARRVIAFEPNRAIVPELRARCGHDPRWTMIEAAIGAGPSLQPFYPRATHGISSMKRDWDGEVVSELEVAVMTLDSAIERWGMPDYCKIDVEGWEFEVLSGLSQPIPLLSFEVHLNDAGVERAKACLGRLVELSHNAYVNVTPAETARFHLAEWRPINGVAEWFPRELRQSLPGDRYGDIYVRTTKR